MKQHQTIRDARELKQHCATRLADCPSDQVYSAKHVPARGDHDLNGGEVFVVPGQTPLKPAAVLVPIIERARGLTIMLTQRQTGLNSHAGQISFPGGKVEDNDRSPLDTALRETEEEVGIAPEFVDVLGYCDDYQTVTGFRIVPVVGLVRDGFSLWADDREVAEIFEVPFDFLMDAQNHRRDSLVWQGKQRHYFAMPYETHYIWGATAGILINLHERLFG